MPLQLAGLQPTGSGAGKASPGGEVLLDLPFEGMLPGVPVRFSDFVNSLSVKQKAAGKENPVLLEASPDFPEAVPVRDASTGIYPLSLFQQGHEGSIRPGGYFKDTGIVPDDVVLQPDANYGGTAPGDTTGQLDPETNAGKALLPVIGIGDPAALGDSGQSESLSTDPVREDAPIPPVLKETNADELCLQVRMDSDGVNGKLPGFQGLETAGGVFVSATFGFQTLEGTAMNSRVAQDAGEPKPLAANHDNVRFLAEGRVWSAGRHAEVSQNAAMILPVLENEKGPQTDVRARVSLVLPETSEKISTQGALPKMEQDVSGNFMEGRDRGYSAPFHGSKPGLPDPRVAYVNVHENTTVSSARPASTAPGGFQKSDPENYFQVEKMTWSLAGFPGTAVSGKDDIIEAARLPLEPREIRTLSDIIEKAVLRQDNGLSQARIELKPAFLGHLHLNVTLDQLKVTIEIRTETHLARDFIETNLHALKADLRESGLQIDKIDVLVDPDLNNQQEQGRAWAHKQMFRMNGQSKDVQTLTHTGPPEPKKSTLSGREESQIDCFV